jgi:hypothetical protein
MSEPRGVDKTLAGVPGRDAPSTIVKPGQTPPGGEPAGNNAAEPKPLTAAEQMALYEEKLKEEDWGHQPC